MHSSMDSSMHSSMDSSMDTVLSFPIRQDKKRHDRKRQEQEREITLRRGARLPPHWILPDEWLIAAEETQRQFNLAPCDLRLEAAKFKDYWVAKAGIDGVKLDWRATWLNWVRRSNQLGHGPPGGAQRAGQFDPLAYLNQQQAGST